MFDKSLVTTEQEKELKALFQKARHHNIIAKFVGIIITILLLFLMIRFAINFQIGGILIAFAIAFCIIFASKSKNELKNALSTDLIPAALSTTFEDFEYFSEDHIDEFVIRDTDMNFPFSEKSMDRISENDLVKGNYHGISFETSNIEIFNEYTDVRGHYHSVLEFNG